MTSTRRVVGLFFGGVSPEHDISVLTALEVDEALELAGYDVVRVFVGRDGTFFHLRSSINPKDLAATPPKNCQPARIELEGGKMCISSANGLRAKIDVVVPAFHGVGGEDGSIQGLCEFARVPYAGSGIGASVIGLDKSLQKAVLRASGIPVLDAITVRIHSETEAANLAHTIFERIGGPMIVKPARLGSSIGITTAHEPSEATAALWSASRYDEKLIVEPLLPSPFELNCAVLGPAPEWVSECEHPLSTGMFLSFDDKYSVSSNQSGSKSGLNALGVIESKREFPAKIPGKLREQVQRLAVETYRALESRGIIRVDFLVDAVGRVFVNEANTIPGSFAFYLWGTNRVEHASLMRRVVDSCWVPTE